MISSKMTNLGIFGVSILFSFVVTVSSFRYKCHRDICDSTWQFCNDEEERCNSCTPEQCQSDVADRILNQCEEKCKQFQTTTKPPTTTVTSPVTSAPLNSIFQDDLINTALLLAILGVLIILLIVACIALCVLYKRLTWITTKQYDVERGSSSGTLTHTVEVNEEVEKRPLLASDNPSDSGRHHNKVGDIHVLAQATGSGIELAEQPHSTPPTYSTNDPKNEASPVKQPTSDVDNSHSLKLGNTELLSDDQQSMAENVTRPKHY